MVTKQLDGVPLAAIGVESALPWAGLPIWYVPPEARRAEWTSFDAVDLEEGRSE